MTLPESSVPPDPSSSSDSGEPGVFSENGPWRIDPSTLRWRTGLDALRAASRAEVPVLMRRRRLPPVGRFAEAGWLIGGALTGWRFVEKRSGGKTSRLGLSRRLRIAFEKLGPAYIKLGQIISSGRGIFPEELVHEFKKCRDQVPPEPFATVKRVIEEDLGRPLSEVFSHFDEQCLAAASIAQVHAATLRTGEAVVVKVQRPRVAEQVRLDIGAMAWIAPFMVGRIPVSALANPPALVELFAETIVEELDFRLEAENMLDIARVLKEAEQKVVVVPRPHPELVTRRVLVMERLRGFASDDVEGMRAAGIDTTEMLRSLLISFLEGSIIYGVFHGDLHGGNLFVMEDGRVALFDFGMTGRLDEKERLAFLRMLMTGAVSDVRAQLEAFRDLGAIAPETDIDDLMRKLKLDQPVKDPAKMDSHELVSEIQDLVKVLLRNGARLPKPLMLFVKGLLFFDGAATQMASDVSIFGQLVQIYAYFAENHADKIARDVGIDPSSAQLDLSGVAQSIGLTSDLETLTHRELVERREKIRKSIEDGGGLPLT